MHFNDSVYGPVSIQEHVLLELIGTQAFQRLHHILQHGITGFLKITQPITRFEHSVGVMLLTRHLGAPLQEQIAALLHDVSHTAFSHVIDHVFKAPGGESYHELMKEWYLEQSDIPPVLAKYGYDWQAFIHEDAYPVLEQPAPALCADRLDYFFRDGIALGLLTAVEARQALRHLRVYDNQICVDTIETARWLGYTYMRADALSWSDMQAIGLYELTAQIIQTGLQVSAIREADVWLSDQALWDKLRQHQDQNLQLQLSRLSQLPHFVEQKNAPWREVTPKIRTLNPNVLVNGNAIELTELDPTFAKALHDYKQSRQGVLSLGIAD